MVVENERRETGRQRRSGRGRPSVHKITHERGDDRHRQEVTLVIKLWC